MTRPNACRLTSISGRIHGCRLFDGQQRLGLNNRCVRSSAASGTGFNDWRAIQQVCGIEKGSLASSNAENQLDSK